MHESPTIAEGIQPYERLSVALADRYRIEREIGKGGMATVYCAEDLKHGRKVALKVLKPELAAVLGAERFVVEIKTTASLQHPNILPLFDSGTADGFLYYVMPFIDGESLRDKLNRETQLGVDEAVRIACDVGEALQYAHDRGVIHRDIKPENILLANGRPMVTDFGIALAVSAAAGGRMTETGLSLGTPHYMSPEQATADKDITARSDEYSLASVLYEMLTGVPPHEGGSAQQTIMRIVTETPRPVSALRRSVPPHVEAAVMRALEKLPADRFASASDFVRALTDTSRLTWSDPARLRGMQSPARRRRWLLWAPTAVALAMTAIAVYALMSVRSARSTSRTPLRYTLAAMSGEGMRALSISADGGTVAYPAIVDGVWRVYVRRLDQLDPVLLPGVEGLLNLVLLPNGRSIVIANARREVSLIPLDGGVTRLLARTTIPAGLSWSNSFGLVLGMPVLSDSLWGLSLVPPGGDSLTVLTNPRPVSMHHSPLVLSDGVTVLYEDIPRRSQGTPVRLGIGNIAKRTWETTNLALESIVGFADGILVYRDGRTFKAVRLDPARRRVVGDPVEIDGVPTGTDAAVMASNGTLVLHTVSDHYQLALVNERGEGDALLPDTLSHLYPRLSPDGKRAVLVSNVRPDGGVWILDLTTHSVSRFGLKSSWAADWTPDGRKIISTDASGNAESFAADASDAQQDSASRRTSNSIGRGSPLASITVSPDGRLAVFGTAFGNGFNLVMRRLDGDTATKILLATAATELAPRFSPDGRWLAYSSDESGRQEIYIQPFPGPGARLQVSNDGGEQPVWSADGRLFYRVGNTFMVAQLARSADAVSVTSRRKLFDGDFYGTGAHAATYDVSADGRHFLLARRIGPGNGQLIAWVDWLGDVKAKLGNKTANSP